MVALPVRVEVYESHPIRIGFDEIKRRLEKDIADLNCTHIKAEPETEEESWSRRPWWMGGPVIMDKTICTGNMYALSYQRRGLADELRRIIMDDLLENTAAPTIEEIHIELPGLNYRRTSVVGMKT